MYLLDKDKKVGKALVLVVGGAQESLLCRPGSYKIILKNRKGFVRIAIKTGYVHLSFNYTKPFHQQPIFIIMILN